MFSKTSSLLLIALIFMGTSQVYGKCFNVNLPVSGVITSTENCDLDPESVLTGSDICNKGTITLNPPYSIEMISTGSIFNSLNNPFVKYISSVVLIKNQNGAEIYGTNAASTNEVTGHSAELLSLSGGSGIFQNATGELIVNATYDFLNNIYTAIMKGQVCLN